MIGAKVGVEDVLDPYLSSVADSTVDYDLEPGQSRDSVTITLSGQQPQTVDYTNEASSARYSCVGAIAPLYDGEGNLVFDGRYYYLYDFRNRLSQVFELVADSGQSAAAMRSAGGAIVSTSALTQARDDILSRLSGSPVQAIRNASRAERSSSTLRAVVPSPYGSSRAGTTVEAQLVLIAAHGYDPFNRRLVRVVPDADVDARTPTMGGARSRSASRCGRTRRGLPRRRR
ncbi:MAG: hypothetical protein IPM29_32785 [Planctomycetes bacterium]|nr:hypothetical protein [Planctomycetota bacterium]